MEFQTVADSPLATKADLLVICTYGDPTKDSVFKLADEALGGYLTERAQAEEFAGRPGQVLFSDRLVGEARALCVVGAGEMNGFDAGRVRDLAANGIRVARRIGAARVVMALPPVSAKHTVRTLQLAIEGALLGSYRFSKYRTDDSRRSDVLKTVLLSFERGRGAAPGKKRGKQAASQTRELNASIERARIVAEAVCHARDLINEPAAVMTPTRLADEARQVGKRHGVTVKVLGPKECEKLGMGMFLAVGQGSEQEPRFIHMTYTPPKRPKRRIALIGKGVTFDSGGYSLKPSQAMEDMKIDMSGAAAVIAAMGAIAQIGSPHEVHAIAACCENLVSGRAYKLGDVLKSMDGTTVEINNTDAEGRLTLGDAITYARNKVQPDQMIDLATLTGACHVALGSVHGRRHVGRREPDRGVAVRRARGRRGNVAPAAALAAARAAQEPARRSAQHRRALRRSPHRRPLPQALRARHAVAARRHRRSRVQRARVRRRAARRHRLRRRHARRVRHALGGRPQAVDAGRAARSHRSSSAADLYRGQPKPGANGVGPTHCVSWRSPLRGGFRAKPAEIRGLGLSEV